MNGPSFVCLLTLTIALSGCVGIGGETINLAHGELVAPPRDATGDVAVVAPAIDEREDKSRIGRATMTVFAITSGSIRTNAPLTETVARDVGAAFEVAGYSVRTVDGEAGSASGPHVQITVRDFYFRNYNWFWPIVPTWGDIAIDLVLREDGGAALFERTLEGSGSSICLLGNCAFSNASNAAWTDLLNELIAVAGSEEFEKALPH